MTVVGSAVTSGAGATTTTSVAATTGGVTGALLGGTTLVGVAAYITDGWTRERRVSSVPAWVGKGGGEQWHTVLSGGETGATLLSGTRLGTVSGSLRGRGDVLGDGLDGRLGEIGVFIGVPWRGGCQYGRGEDAWESEERGSSELNGSRMGAITEELEEVLHRRGGRLATGGVIGRVVYPVNCRC